MEQAQLRLHEHSLGLLPRATGPGPLDHFFPPLLPGLQGVPGVPSLHGGLPTVGSFLTHAHTSYPSYLTPPASSPLGVIPTSVVTSAGSPFGSPPGMPLSPPLTSTGDQGLTPPPPSLEEDPRSSSIVALRLKAKEHLQLLNKTTIV